MVKKAQNHNSVQMVLLSHRPEPLFRDLLSRFLAAASTDDIRAKKAADFIRAHYVNGEIGSGEPIFNQNSFEGWSPDEKNEFFRIWQLVPMLMQVATDQALRNKVYADKAKSGQSLVYSIEGAIRTEDIDTLPIDVLERRYDNTVTITWTRHPTNIFAPEVYDNHEQLRDAVHDLAKAYYLGNPKPSFSEFDGAMAKYAATKPGYDGGKMPASFEGRQVLKLFTHTYHGMDRVSERMLNQLSSAKDPAKRAQLIVRMSKKWRPVRLATWSSADQDNNFNAKEHNMAQLFRESVAELKGLYSGSLDNIRGVFKKAGLGSLIPPVPARSVISANDDIGSKTLHETVAEMKEEMDQYILYLTASKSELIQLLKKQKNIAASDKYKLGAKILLMSTAKKERLLLQAFQMRAKLNCFEDHPFDLDFRQDVSVTSDICDLLLGPDSLAEKQTVIQRKKELDEDPALSHKDRTKALADFEAPIEERRIKALVGLLDELDADGSTDPRERVNKLQQKVEEKINAAVKSIKDLKAALKEAPNDKNSSDSLKKLEAEYSHLGQMLETVKTLRLMQDYPNAARQYTLSSFSKASNWLEMQLLLKLGGLDKKGIVPLSESDESLTGIGDVLRRLSKEPQFNDKLEQLNKIITMMQAKSDPPRESGAYIVGSQTEWLIQVVNFIYENNATIADPSKFLKAILYVGGSLDNNRSMFNPAHIQNDLYRAILYVAKKRGLQPEEAGKLGHMFAPDFQFTIQGRDGELCFGTDLAAADTIAKSYASSVHFRHGLDELTETIKNDLDKTPNIVADIDEFIAASHERKESYQFFFDKLLNGLNDVLPKELRKAANISSRIAGRGSDDLTAARAIDLQGAFHVLGIHANEWLGAELDTPEKARARFVACPEERRQVMSALVGLARTDFDGAFEFIGGRNQFSPDVINESAERMKKFFGGEYKTVAEALEGVDIGQEYAILSWMETKYKVAKVNALCAIGMFPDEAEKWDFRNGLPFDHPINDEIKLFTAGERDNRALLTAIKDEGLAPYADEEKKIASHALESYRTGLEFAITPTSSNINATIAKLHVLTKKLAGKNARDYLIRHYVKPNYGYAA